MNAPPTKIHIFTWQIYDPIVYGIDMERDRSKKKVYFEDKDKIYKVNGLPRDVNTNYSVN